MQEITGIMSSIGSGTIRQVGSKAFVSYDYIEIGDRMLQKIRTARSLGDFIDRGVGQEVTLYLNGNMIVGVKLPGGKIYYWKRSNAVVVLCLVLLPIWGLGLLMALLLWSDMNHILVIQRKLAALGGIPLQS